MTLNNEQKELTLNYIQSNLNVIKKGYSSEKMLFLKPKDGWREETFSEKESSLKAFRLILKKDLTEDDLVWIKSKDFNDIIQRFRYIISHPCPQNMSDNNLVEGPHLEIISSEVSGNSDVIKYSYRGVTKTEQKGIFGLTAKNSDDVPHVNRRDVVNLIKKELQDRIIALSEDIEVGEREKGVQIKRIKAESASYPEYIKDILYNNLEAVLKLNNGDLKNSVKPIDIKALKKIGRLNYLSLEVMLKYSDSLQSYMAEGNYLNDIKKIAKNDHSALETMLKNKKDIDELRKWSNVKFCEVLKAALAKNDVLNVILKHKEEAVSLLAGSDSFITFKDLKSIGEKNPDSLRLILENHKSIKCYLSEGVNFNKIKSLAKQNSESFRFIIEQQGSILDISRNEGIPVNTTIKLAFKGRELELFLGNPELEKYQRWIRRQNNIRPSVILERFNDVMPFNMTPQRQR